MPLSPSSRGISSCSGRRSTFESLIPSLGTPRWLDQGGGAVEAREDLLAQAGAVSLSAREPCRERCLRADTLSPASASLLNCGAPRSAPGEEDGSRMIGPPECESGAGGGKAGGVRPRLLRARGSQTGNR